MRSLLTFTIAAIALASPGFAHHPFSVEFDASQPITLTGTVTKIEWMNPHTYFYLDVKDSSSGKVANWKLETASPAELTRHGWKRDEVKLGDQLTVQAYRARDGSNLANARMITLPNGNEVFGGSAGDKGPQTATRQKR